MPVIQDEEFGKITVRRSAIAKQVKLRVAPDGSLRASLPIKTPIFFVKHLLKNSRPELRKILAQAKPNYIYENGMHIGKSHTLIIQPTSNENFSVSRSAQQIILRLPYHMNIQNEAILKAIREATINALRLEAKSYLPRRLAFLAEKHGYNYKSTHFSHASGRWGSCSSSGTISLNIALMKLPFELIDYVIIHELSHTKQMNHGKLFWALVAKADPDYKQHRKLLKAQNPSI